MTTPSVVRAVAARTPESRRFGRIVRERRIASGLDQSELGDAVGASQPTVCRWEAGLAVPGLPTLIQLADVLGFSLDELRAAS